MKTAVIVAGVCRFTNISSKSWNIFPDADWYLSTWDITQLPYSKQAKKSDNEIEEIRYRFKSIIISNYKEEYLDAHVSYNERPFLLLEKVFNLIKDCSYKRIIYFRPDLVLFKINEATYPNLTQFELEEFNESDFLIDDSQVKVAYGHCLGTFWVDYQNKIMQDSFFLFSWNNFVKFIQNKKSIAKYKDIHRSLFKFFCENNIKPSRLEIMYVTILRSNILQNLDKTTWFELAELFSETYNQMDYIGKFIKEIEVEETILPDFAKIEESKRSGGILRLRKQQ